LVGRVADAAGIGSIVQACGERNAVAAEHERALGSVPVVAGFAGTGGGISADSGVRVGDGRTVDDALSARPNVPVEAGAGGVVDDPRGVGDESAVELAAATGPVAPVRTEACLVASVEGSGAGSRAVDHAGAIDPVEA